jgi:tRNA(adenine34) deaminase
MLTEANGHGPSQSDIDAAMMQRCIRLSATAALHGEFPFAALICRNGEVIAETINRVVRSADVTRHAELIAVSEAQIKLGTKDLSDCTLYSNVEPCAMCSFPIRETRISRVIFAIRSPIMGGLSRWNVLRDGELTRAMPEAFGSIPEVIAGLGRRDAERVWWKWNPVIWTIIRHRGCFGKDSGSDICEHLKTIPTQSLISKLWRLHQNRRWA